MTKTEDIIKRYISNRNAKAAISKWKKMNPEQKIKHIKQMNKASAKKRAEKLSTP